MARKGIFKSDEEKELKVWSNGKIIRGAKKIDSLNYVMHYASPCVWEGIRAYEQSDGTTKIFELKAHIDRLYESAKIIGFEIPYEKHKVMEGCKALVEQLGGGDLYLRPIAYAAGDAESAKPQNQHINMDIYAFPLKTLHEDKKAVKLIISSFIRSYPQHQMQAKTAENYSFLQKVKPELQHSGADDALLCDKDGYIVEATVANIFVCKGSVVMTPPNDGSILPGITRANLGKILQSPDMNLKYNKPTRLVEKRITRADIYTADCIILCGTYAEVVKVGEVDGRKIDGDDTYYRILKNEYSDVVRGRKGDA